MQKIKKALWVVGDVFGIDIKKDGTFDDSQSPVDFEMFAMDTKRQTSEEYCKDVALKAKKLDIIFPIKLIERAQLIGNTPQ
jgi:hypothetical protein